jgi:hypothetical protein
MIRRTSSRSRRDLWQGFHPFECPAYSFESKGSIAGLVLANLYGRASAMSAKAKGGYRLRFTARLDSLEKKLRCSHQSIVDALRDLEKERFIHREKNRDPSSRKFQTGKVTILNPETRNPLLASPARMDLLTANNGHYLPGFHSAVMPFECLRKLNQLDRPAARAVYLAALRLASEARAERFKVDKSWWHKLTGLSRQAFARGFREVRRKGLLTLRGHTLTLNDPETKKPSTRKPLPVPMPIDFNNVPPSGWEKVFKELLGGDFIANAEGWTITTKDRDCPLCHHSRSFSLHFAGQGFHCFNCGASGKLATLVREIRRCSWREVGEYVLRVLQTPEDVPLLSLV